MRSDEALGRLIVLLDAAGVDRARPAAADVRRTWEVMRGFAREPVEDADPPAQQGDAILAQYGTRDRGRGDEFMLDMTRQFAFSDSDGEYLGMAQMGARSSST